MASSRMLVIFLHWQWANDIIEQIRTTTTDLLGIKHPIFLAGMNVAAGPHLAAAVTNAGGLGVIGGLGYTPEMLKEQVGELKSHLHDKNAPFGIDLLLPQIGGSARKTKLVFHSPENTNTDLLLAMTTRKASSTSWSKPSSRAAPRFSFRLLVYPPRRLSTGSMPTGSFTWTWSVTPSMSRSVLTLVSISSALKVARVVVIRVTPQRPCSSLPSPSWRLVTQARWLASLYRSLPLVVSTMARPLHRRSCSAHLPSGLARVLSCPTRPARRKSIRMRCAPLASTITFGQLFSLYVNLTSHDSIFANGDIGTAAPREE